MCRECGPSITITSGTKAPSASTASDRMPAVPRRANLAGSRRGMNRLTLPIMERFEREERISLAAILWNSGSIAVRRAPDPSISITLGSMLRALLAASYPYGLKTGTALGPTSQDPSTLTIQWGSRKGYRGLEGTE